MIPFPYLLYLGDSTDGRSVKTSRGVAVWRPEQCLGEYLGQACTVSLGLPHLGFAKAAAAGAKTIIIGVANAGGVMGASAVQHAVAALKDKRFPMGRPEVVLGADEKKRTEHWSTASRRRTGS